MEIFPTLIMEALVVYFSHSGRTKRVAETIASQLSNYAVDLEGITFTGTFRDYIEGGPNSITAGNWSKFIAKETIFDLAPYDLVCVGMPVHGGTPTLVFDAYLKRCKGLSGKKVCTFQTCRFMPGKSTSTMRQGLEAAGALVKDQLVCRAMFRIGTKKAAAFGQRVNAGTGA